MGGLFEINQLLASGSSSHECRVALIFPEIYPFAINSYALQLLYALFNSHPYIRCERFVYPLTPAGKQSPPQSLESGAYLKDFPIIAVSFQVEEDYFRFAWFLSASGIRARTEERTKVGGPIIVAGGPATSANPLPVFPFLDALVLGDIEPIWALLSELIACISHLDRNTFLERLGEFPGIITQETFDPTGHYYRNVLPKLDESPHPTKQVVPEEIPTELMKLFPFKRTLLVEVNRGCPNSCHFCITGHQRNPFRNRSLEVLQDIIIAGLKSTRVEKVTLIGSAINLHPQLIELLEFLRDLGVTVTLPSLYAPRVRPEMLKLLRDLSLKTFTIAPETCAPLRPGIGKIYSDSEYLSIIQDAKEVGLENVKMYFLLGLPGEKETHLTDLVNFVEDISKIFGSPRSTRLSVNPLVPKANTPLERFTDNFASKDGFARLESRFFRLKKLLQALGTRNAIKYVVPDLKAFKIQAYLSLGDEKFAPLLENFSNNPLTVSRFESEAKSLGLSLTDHMEDLKTREDLPWSFIAP